MFQGDSTVYGITHRPHPSVHPGTPNVEEVGHHHDLVKFPAVIFAKDPKYPFEK
jgi:hypothetical protein